MKKWWVIFSILLIGAKSKAQTAEELIKQYRFTEAQSALQNDIKKLKKQKLSTFQKEELLNLAQKGQQMLVGTEKVVFVDSFVVNRKDFMTHLKLNRESGKIEKYDQFTNKKDSTNDCTVYVNERGTTAYLAVPGKAGMSQLYQSNNLDGKWSSPTPLEGLRNLEEKQNYPFMCADGVTLYYAAEGENSLGGYDIFATRYSTEEKRFLQPENIGMPFNSPANDYLYAVDEMNNLGWFVSDRNQPADKVCIYVFVPTETRDVYDYEKGNKNAIQRAARICSISESWGDKKMVKEAQKRLNEVMKSDEEEEGDESAMPSFEFVINDRITYLHRSQFRSKEARNRVQEWETGCSNLKKQKEELEKKRDIYAEANSDEKAKMKDNILEQEKQTEKETIALHQMEKEIRNLENEAINK